MPDPTVTLWARVKELEEEQQLHDISIDAATARAEQAEAEIKEWRRSTDGWCNAAHDTLMENMELEREAREQREKLEAENARLKKRNEQLKETTVAYLCYACSNWAYTSHTTFDSGTVLTCKECKGKTVVNLGGSE